MASQGLPQVPQLKTTVISGFSELLLISLSHTESHKPQRQFCACSSKKKKGGGREIKK